MLNGYSTLNPNSEPKARTLEINWDGIDSFQNEQSQGGRWFPNRSRISGTIRTENAALRVHGACTKS